jgi:uncharacterized protein (DUF697 family)
LPLTDVADFALRNARQLQALVEEVRKPRRGRLVLAGEPGLTSALRDALTAGGSASAVVVPYGTLEQDHLAGAIVAVHAAAGVPLPAEHVRALRLVDRRRIPLVALVAGDEPVPVGAIPYVLATDVVLAAPGAGLPVRAVTRRIAVRAGADGYRLAAQLPVLRQDVCDELVRHYARLSGAIGAAVFVPGADLPAITLNQLRMVARIAAAHGIELDSSRLAELAAVVGAGFGWRAVARGAAGLVPGPGWAVKGAVAYAGTRAIGRAAIARCASIAGSP